MYLSEVYPHFFFIAVVISVPRALAAMQDIVHAQDDIYPVVITRSGSIRGKYLDAGNKLQVSAFYGIPYAKPPVKELRFAEPQSPDPWGPRQLNATEFGPACFHQDDTVFPGFPGAEMWNSKRKSEDCLYLNVWMRSGIPSTENLAVMVWIYGGSFFSGGSSLDVYDGTTLAATYDVIVVSLNYRLGPLGFLPPMAGTTPANAGFLDQIKALKWVRDEISSFGGDPDRVTLFGESAGAVCNGLHLVSPLSKGLVNRVIMQSGNQLTPWATNDLDTAKSRMRQMASALNCIGDEASILACFRSKSADEFFSASWVSSDIFDFPFVPVRGTDSIPEDPKVTTAKGENSAVETLLGWNSNEGSYFNLYTLNGFNKDTESIISRDQYIDGISKCGLNTNTVGEEAVGFFYSNWKNPSDPVQYRDALDQIVSDYHIVCPVIDLARLHKRQSKVFVYHLSYRLSNNPWPKWMGVMHGYEIELVFGLPFSLKHGHNYNNRDRHVAHRLTRYWTNFAKYGDPNGDTKPGDSPSDSSLYWPPMSSDDVTYVEISGNRDHVRRSPNSFQCAFWNNYLPSLEAASSDWIDSESRWKLQFHRWENSMDNWERSFEKYSKKRNKQSDKCLN